MTTLPFFSSVPGQAIPGMASPGRVGVSSTAATSYQFYGHQTLYYLDYLDSNLWQTLVAVPGASYVMIAVNSRAGLTVPPPDGRWVPGSDVDFLVFRPRQPSLAEVRADLERARVAHGHYAAGVCRICAPQSPLPEVRARTQGPVPPPVIRRVSGPDFAPQPSLAEVRADLERSRVAHGHYAAGMCKRCLSGGQEG